MDRETERKNNSRLKKLLLGHWPCNKCEERTTDDIKKALEKIGSTEYTTQIGDDLPKKLGDTLELKYKNKGVFRKEKYLTISMISYRAGGGGNYFVSILKK